MNLQQFLNENTVENVTSEVVVSDRFRDENGNIMKFKIRAVSGEEHSEYKKKCTVLDPRRKTINFDENMFKQFIVINATISPNFRDAESIQSIKCVTPEQYLNKTMLAGEIAELMKKISELSGFDKEIEELREDVKN